MKRKSKKQRRFLAFAMMLVMIITMIPASVVKAEQYDVNPPEISEFTFVENGQTIEAGTQLHVTFKAVDAEEAEILKENVTLKIGKIVEDVTDIYDYNPNEFEKVEDKYQAVFQLSSDEMGEYMLCGFEVIDSSGNSAKLDFENLPEEEKYKFTVGKEFADEEGEFSNNVIITDIAFSQDTVILTEEQPSCGITCSFKVENKTELPDELEAEFEMILKDSDGWQKLHASTSERTYSYDETDGYYKLVEAYEGDSTFEIYKNYNGTQFEFDKINITGKTVTCDVEKSIEIVRQFTDNEGPALKELYLTKNGERLKTGAVVTAEDEIKIVADIDDKNEISSIRVSLQTDLENISENYKMIYLDYNETSKLYEGTVDGSDFYPTEWYFDWFFAEDEYGNETDITRYIGDSTLLEDNIFLLKKENTCVLPTYDITVNMQGNDGYKSYDIVSERVTSLNALFPNGMPNVEVEGKTLLGWCWNGDTTTLLDEDDIIVLNRDTNYYSLEPVYDKVNVWAYIYYFDENGERISLEHKIQTETGITYQEIIEKLDFPQNHESKYEFVKWNYSQDLNEKINRDTGIEIEAEYKQYPVEYSYSYLTKDNRVKTERVNMLVEKGTTVRDICEFIQLPLDASEKEMLGWCVNGVYWLDDEISLWNNTVSVSVQYSDLKPVHIYYDYVNQDALLVQADQYMYIPAETASEEVVIEKAMKIIADSDYNVHSDLEVKDCWQKVFVENEFAEGYGEESEIYISETYDKTILQLQYPDREAKGIILNTGETYTFPTTYNGYDITWAVDYNYEYIEGVDSITADKNMYFIWAWAEYEGEVAPDTDKPDNDTPNTDTNTPGSDNNTSDTDNVPTDKPSTEDTTTELENKTVEEKTQEIKKADAGATIVIDMKKENGQVATTVPVEILEAAKGKDVDVVLNMGSYSWTINGKNINATQLQDINLEVKMDTNAVPSATINALADGKPTRQLSLTHNGNFGFKASLTVNVGSEHEGEYGNLYYHDSNGKLVFMNAGKIQADGSVSLDFSHASDYVIVISENQHTITTSPATNDANLTWLWFMLLIATVVIMKEIVECNKSKAMISYKK